MFENLSERLGGVFDRLTKQGALSDADVATALREVRVAGATGGVHVDNPFELKSAVLFGLLVVVVVVVAHAVRATLGDGALVLAGLVAGLTDVDAITLSAATLAEQGLTASVAAATILAAVVSNTAMKTVAVMTIGGPAIGRQIARVSGVTLAAGALVTVALWLRAP